MEGKWEKVEDFMLVIDWDRIGNDIFSLGLTIAETQVISACM